MDDTYERLCLEVQILESESYRLRVDLRENEQKLFDARYAQVEAEIKGSMPEEIAAMLPENNRKIFMVQNRHMTVHRLLTHWLACAEPGKLKNLDFWLAVLGELAWVHCKVYADPEYRYEQEMQNVEKALKY